MKKTIIRATAVFSVWMMLPVLQAAEPLLLDWGVIETGSDEQQSASDTLRVSTRWAKTTSTTVEEKSAWLVQFDGIIQPEWREALEATGAEIKGYMPENAYLITATPSVLAIVAELEHVYWLGEWKAEYKKSQPVRTRLARRTTTSSTDANVADYRVLGFDPAARDELAARLAELPGAIVLFVDDLGDRSMVTATLTLEQVEEVTEWPDVEWVEPRPVPKLLNDQAARTNMMNISNVWATTGTGLGLTGKGQIVAVADTGLDTGNLATLHLDFTNRVTGFAWSNGAYRTTASWGDADSHGTHVAGSVLGSGALSTNRYRGMAYEASLIVQGCQTNLGGLPSSVITLFQQAYTNGARIHSDSWGYIESAGEYLADCRSLDQYVWSNQSFLAVFAASNDGIDADSDGVVDPNSISPPGTAKNCLTVGAAENYRSTGGYSTMAWGSAWPDDYPAAPIKSDKISQTTSPQGLAAFSSRGPCADGRIKPDIVAPGTDVISTRSRSATSTGWGTVSGNTNYIYMGGTSMATPLTSGALALQRQWLIEERGIENPTAALMKALIISGARNMAPGQYGTGTTQEIPYVRPSNSQGYGHVDLYNTLAPGDDYFLELHDGNTLATSRSNSFTVTVGYTNAGTYIFTMAYSDYWAATGSGKKLVNNLDLTVRTPSGKTIYPNGLSTTDQTNNVEMVEFTADEVGDYTVIVNGQNVPSGSSQPYALVMRGPVTVVPDPVAPVFTRTTYTTHAALNDEIEYDFTEYLTEGYPTAVVSLQTTVNSDEYIFEDGYLYYVPETSGTHVFACVAANASGSTTSRLTVVVAYPPPSAPQNLRASVTNVTSFTAAWNAVADATEYRLDVAQGAEFLTDGTPGGVLLTQGFESSLPSGWSTNGASTTSTQSANGNSSLAFKGKDAYLITPAVTNPATVSLAYRRSSNTTAWTLQIQVAASLSGTWTTVNSISDASTSWQTATIDLSTDENQVVYLRFFDTRTTGTHERYVDDIEVIGSTSAGNVTNYLSGYSNVLVSATQYEVSGLAANTLYAFRVRAASSSGTSGNSSVATVATLNAASLPVWATLPSQTVQVGNTLQFNAADYAAGNPSPTIHLESSTATAGTYSFNSGQLAFAPTATGSYSFIFSASNSVGKVNATLSVTVNPAPVTVPTLTLSAATTSSFEADWTACDGVSSYMLQVATDGQFSVGGAGGTQTLLSNIATNPTPIPTGWIYQLPTNGVSYLLLMGSSMYVQSPAFSTIGMLSLNIDFTARTYGGVSGNSAQVTVSISTDGGVTWNAVDTRTPTSNGLVAQSTIDASAYIGFADVRVKWQAVLSSAARGAGISALVISGTEPSGTGSLILDTTISGISRTVTNLTAETAYYARVKGNDAWSTIQTISTLADGPQSYDDWLEEEYGEDPTNPLFDPQADADGDGISNYDEYLAGSDPTDSGSRFEMILEDEAAVDEVVFSFDAQTNRFYQLISYTNLLADPMTNNLGWGTPGMQVTNRVLQEWFGLLRVLLEEPEE